MFVFIIEAPSAQADNPKLQEKFTKFLVNKVIPSINSGIHRNGQVTGAQLFTPGTNEGSNQYVLMIDGFFMGDVGRFFVKDAVAQIEAAGGKVRSLPGEYTGWWWTGGKEGHLVPVEATAVSRPEAGEASNEGAPAPS
ncbi:hypothetical protein JY651_33165 [Pyxidicoccus parkwayensis]|uniref:Uncharacterized protein n=1 Tax=Pyxidicoccus parkwayensis TaxID=2813578 RepID=A0ABX7NMM5_9BACT|nr:hypothetical protein [Pyxidicoccus parkwaysis]QSQ20099.1 hypothetical protein JY651_33165 [Pyxidicoccus parkwaysis]